MLRSPAPPHPDTTPRPLTEADLSKPGRGHVAFEYVAGKTAITRCRAAAPLKFLTPSRRGDAAWAYANTFGGGLVAGDTIDLSLDVGDDATAVLTTQASTKVFHQQDGLGAQQHLTATLGEQAKLLVLPDPLTCFADAIYSQTQHFELTPSSSLVLLDWFTAGRSASGESWEFAEYRSLNTVHVDGREMVFDQMRLTADTLANTGPMCVGPYQVVANLFLVGPEVSEAVDQLEQWIDKLPIRDEAGYLAGFSRCDWGGVLRLMGRSTQTLTGLLKQQLYFTHPWIGGSPWDRKW
ncbi:MAG: urease accessory protein UreD [Planctomycetota bacterium]